MALTQLIYTSVAVRDMSKADLEDILSAALKRNAELDVTGLLAYFRETREFIQLLEGEEAAVLDLYHNAIARDARHRSVEIFFIEQEPKRIFPDWRMSFRLEPGGTLQERMGYSDFVDGGALEGGEKTLSRRLMLAYRDEIERSEA